MEEQWERENEEVSEEVRKGGKEEGRRKEEAVRHCDNSVMMHEHVVFLIGYVHVSKVCCCW